MRFDLQKANIWKRASAFLLDGILLAILATGFIFLLSAITGYDVYNEKVNASYEKYESEYGITFEITEEEFLALTDEDAARYQAAYDALLGDEDAMKAYSMVMSLTLMMTTFGILLAYLVLEFAVPLFFKNGQTVGKKIFGLGLVRENLVRVNTVSLFVRTLLGKYTIETMIPVFLILMIYFGMVGLVGTMVVLGILLLQVILLLSTRNHSLIHDLLANTVVTDLNSQMVYESEEALIEAQKQAAAEDAARNPY